MTAPNRLIASKIPSLGDTDDDRRGPTSQGQHQGLIGYSGQPVPLVGQPGGEVTAGKFKAARDDR